MKKCSTKKINKILLITSQIDLGKLIVILLFPIFLELANLPTLIIMNPDSFVTIIDSLKNLPANMS